MIRPLVRRCTASQALSTAARAWSDGSAAAELWLSARGHELPLKTRVETLRGSRSAKHNGCHQATAAKLRLRFRAPARDMLAGINQSSSCQSLDLRAPVLPHLPQIVLSLKVDPNVGLSAEDPS